MAWLKSFWTTLVFACSSLRLALIGAKSHGNRVYLSAKVKIRHAEALTLGEDVFVGACVQLLSDGATIQVGPWTTLLRNTLLTTHGAPIIMGADCSLNHFSIIYGGMHNWEWGANWCPCGHYST